MADENNVEPTAVAIESGVETKSPVVAKPKSSARKKAAVTTDASVSKAAKPKGASPRRYSDAEKLEKLNQIKSQVSEGVTLKAAIKSAGISEQTYYVWKQASRAPVESQGAPAPAGDDLQELVQLEKENQRLRKLLSEKLRAENADLRKKLGFD